jgi:hypothetical protein
VCSAVAEALIGARDQLNELDAVSGDGDCGLTLARGAHEVGAGGRRRRIVLIRDSAEDFVCVW